MVSPLRERREDLLPLVTRLVSALGKDIGRRRLTVSSRASDTHTGNNQLKAAEIFGVSRNTLRRRLLDFGILVERASPMQARRGTRATTAANPPPAKKSRGAR